MLKNCCQRQTSVKLICSFDRFEVVLMWFLAGINLIFDVVILIEISVMELITKWEIHLILVDKN
jgi:hypothetical protein